MKKRLLPLALLCLCALPWLALGEAWTVEKNKITFPALDGMTAYFRDAADWTIVTRDNLETHLDRVTRRGDSPQAVRERFAEESLLWEAYSDKLPQDACIRMERFEDEASRELWHLRYLTTQERYAYQELTNSGLSLDKYDTWSAKYREGKVLLQRLYCNFTSRPPAPYESGVLEIRFINGRQYLLSYAVLGRRASRSSYRSGGENGALSKLTPFNENMPLAFETDYLPPLPDFALAEALPAQADLGDLKLTGSVAKGSALRVALDGENVTAQVDKKGGFTVILPLNQPGAREVVFTVTHPDCTERVERFTLNVSDRLTPLHLTQYPEALALAGDQAIAGETAPGAAVTLQLDEGEPIPLKADEAGKFSFTLFVMDDQPHILVITAVAPERDESVATVSFLTQYETFKAGIKAFQKGLTKETIAHMAKSPGSFVGEKVKISVIVKKVTYTKNGLGILCDYNPPRGSKAPKTPLFLTLYGYGQDLIYQDMVITIYGRVLGEETLLSLEGGAESRLNILVEYGTYLKS